MVAAAAAADRYARGGRDRGILKTKKQRWMIGKTRSNEKQGPGGGCSEWRRRTRETLGACNGGDLNPIIYNCANSCPQPVVIFSWVCGSTYWAEASGLTWLEMSITEARRRDGRYFLCFFCWIEHDGQVGRAQSFTRTVVEDLEEIWLAEYTFILKCSRDIIRSQMLFFVVGISMKIGGNVSELKSFLSGART